MRKPIIAGNWKLNKTIKESLALVEGLKNNLSGVKNVEIVVCPVYTALSAVAALLKGTNIKLGGQDAFWQDSGAYTGEVSVPMLKDAGASYIIVGHSERRQYFNETNETVNNKIKAVLKHGLIPIVCVGEKLEERDKNETFNIVENHIRGAFNGIAKSDTKNIVIAYEPVWAIGTGRTATPQQAEEVHAFIRGLIVKLYDQTTADGMRIQYGGSVKPENIRDLMAENDVDGALVGGASLDIETFTKIVKYN